MYLIKNDDAKDKKQKDYMFSKIFNMIENKSLINLISDWYNINYEMLNQQNLIDIYNMMHVSDKEFYIYLKKIFNEIGSLAFQDIIDLEFIIKNLERCYVARILVADFFSAEQITNYLTFLKESRYLLPNNIIKQKISNFPF